MKTHIACIHILPLLLGCVSMFGCDKSASPPASPTSAAPQEQASPLPQKVAQMPQDRGNVALAEAKSIMAQRCTLCHGLEGRGNGPAAGNLNPKPANYTDPAWQASVDDDTLRKAIIGGGPSVGKSMMMPANPDLKDKPQVVDELVKLIRGFKK